MSEQGFYLCRERLRKHALEEVGEANFILLTEKHSFKVCSLEKCKNCPTATILDEHGNPRRNQYTINLHIHNIEEQERNYQ